MTNEFTPDAGVPKTVVRRQKIVEIVTERGKVAVDDLATMLAISRETIRRDLTVLADAGRVRKTHGNALRPRQVVESAFTVRMSEAAEEKRRVAARTAALFAGGDALFVDTGTTTVAFAEALCTHSGLTVITNSLSIAQILSRGTGQHRVYLLGGEYRAEANETVGPLVIEQIRTFNAAHAVLTVGAITVSGVLDYSLEEVEVARAMVQRAKTITVLADATKFGREALFNVCPLDTIDRMIVSGAPEPELQAALARAGVELIVAD